MWRSCDDIVGLYLYHVDSSSIGQRWRSVLISAASMHVYFRCNVSCDVFSKKTDGGRDEIVLCKLTWQKKRVYIR